MENLIDDVWLIILKYLNLNERAKLRLVSKKWKFFIDKFVIKKLVIFVNTPPTAGRLKLRNERFCLGDTVYVKNWESFIQNEFVIRQLTRSVEKMVIFNSDKKVLSFYDIELERLLYLELHDVKINEQSKFLENSKIESLFVYFRDHLDYFRKDQEDIEKTNRKFAFLKQMCKTNKLRHLNIRKKLTIEFFKDCRDALSGVQVLDVHIRDIKTLLYINNEFKSLKVLNTILFEGIDKFSSYLSPLCLNALKRKMRQDLTVYLYCIPFREDTINFICDYLIGLKNNIRLCNSEIIYTIDERSNQKMIEYKNYQSNLDRLYYNINLLIIQRPFFNEAAFRKMVNVTYLHFNLKYGHRYNKTLVAKVLEIFTNIKEFKLTFHATQENGNQIIQLLPQHCFNVFSIIIKSANHTKLNFTPLLQLNNLKVIKIYHCKPFDHDLIHELVKNLQYLTFFEISFDRPEDFDEEDCKLVEGEMSFKMKSILKEKNLGFHVETQKTLDSDTVYYSIKKRT